MNSLMNDWYQVSFDQLTTCIITWSSILRYQNNSADMCIDQCCITLDLALLIWTIGDARIRGDVLFRYIKKRGKCCTCGLKNIWTLSNRHLMTLAGSLFTFLKGEKNTRGIISNLKSYYSYSGHVLVQWTDNWILNNTYKMTNRSSLF